MALLTAGPAMGQGTLGVTGVAGVTDLRPVSGGGRASEFALEQLMIRGEGRLGAAPLRLWGSVSGEGATMGDGSLNAGAFGEGMIDRRHPHTYLHELGVSVVVPVGSAVASLSAGKGFVAFGTDDPMHRPAFKYPVNHHWAQILERFVAIAAVRVGRITFEASAFNGDEPHRPWHWPSMDRFGDSWAARVSVALGTGLDVQLSHARVASPEDRTGGGPDAAKWSAALGYTLAGPEGRARVLGEWARTRQGGQAYQSLLVEGEWTAGHHRPYLRLEQSDRPEPDRSDVTDPHGHGDLLGVTRWSVVTLGYGYRITTLGLGVEPLVEVAVANVRETTTGAFDPTAVYGPGPVRSITIALRVRWGSGGTMGRYGVWEEAAQPSGHAGHD